MTSKLKNALLETCAIYEKTHEEERFSNCREANRLLIQYLESDPERRDEQVVDYVKKTLIPLAEKDNRNWKPVPGSALFKYLKAILLWHENEQMIFARVEDPQDPEDQLKRSIFLAMDLFKKAHRKEFGSDANYDVIDRLNRAIRDNLDIRNEMNQCIQLIKGQSKRLSRVLATIVEIHPLKKPELAIEPLEAKQTQTQIIQAFQASEPTSTPAKQPQGYGSFDTASASLNAETLAAHTQNFPQPLKNFAASIGSGGSVRTLATVDGGQRRGMSLEAAITAYYKKIDQCDWSDYERHVVKTLIKSLKPYLSGSMKLRDPDRDQEALQGLFIKVLLQLAHVGEPKPLKNLLLENLNVLKGQAALLALINIQDNPSTRLSEESNFERAKIDGNSIITHFFKKGHIVGDEEAANEQMITLIKSHKAQPKVVASPQPA